MNLTEIPLKQLVEAPENIRKAKSQAHIERLAASIKAQGLLQNLIVRKDGKQFAVVAGQQRLAALKLLVKAGDMKADFKVPCQVKADSEVAETSLAENDVRADMHPADKAEAFAQLVEGGASAADVGARFGVTETHVQRLLRVARVSPKIVKAWRAEKLTLEHVQAFAVTEDRKAQERVFAELKSWTRPFHIREALLDDEVPVDDGRVKFVSRKAYEAAGGKIRENLFAGLQPRADDDDDEDPLPGAFIEDRELLAKLVSEKLEHVAKSVAGEGWKWVEVRADYTGYSGEFRKLSAEPPPLPGKLQAEYDALNAQIEKLEGLPYDEETNDEIDAKLDGLSKAVGKLEKQRGKPRWTPEQLAVGGVVVSLDEHTGKSEIFRGLVKQADRKAGDAAQSAAEGVKPGKGSSGDEAGDPAVSGLSGAMIENLSAQKTAALAATLMDKPRWALAALVHSLLCQVLLVANDQEVAVKVRPSRGRLQQVSESTASKTLRTRYADLRKQLGFPDDEDEFPGDGDDAQIDRLWEWCCAKSIDELLNLCALLVALSLDGVRFGGRDAGWMEPIADSAALDMRQWWTATAESYFGRVSRALSLEAIVEATGQPAKPEWNKLKKGELATLAEQEVRGKGWLPPILRVDFDRLPPAPPEAKP